MNEQIEESKKNNATEDFIYFINQTFKRELEKKETDKISEIIVTVLLEGKIVFPYDFLSDFKNLTSITFLKGKITSLENIPKKVSKLVISDNYLTEFSTDGIYENLIELVVTNNYLKSFDFMNTPNLETFEAENNKLETIENIHSKLKVLNFNKNNLKHLELKEASNLINLRVSNNPLLFLQNIPSSVVEFESDNNAKNILQTNEEDVEVSEASIQRSLSYLEALERYFELKSNYETELLDDKKIVYKKSIKKGSRYAKNKVRSIRGKCIKCGKSEGTIFRVTNEYYTAICGSSQSEKCELNIKLFRGVNWNLTDRLEYFKEKVDENKTNIIILKLDNLFNYINENTSVKLFEKEIAEFNTNNDTYTDSILQYTSIFNNKEKNNLLKSKILKTQELKKNIRELLENDNETDLNIVSEIYIKELKPEMENIQRLYNEIIETEVIFNDDDFAYLLKEEINPVKLDTEYEKPRVEKFII